MKNARFRGAPGPLGSWGQFCILCCLVILFLINILPLPSPPLLCKKPHAIRTWLGSGTPSPKVTPRSYKAAAKSQGTAPICFIFSRYKDDLNHTKTRRSSRPSIRLLPDCHLVWGAAAVGRVSARAWTAGSWKIPRPFPQGQNSPSHHQKYHLGNIWKNIRLLGHMPAPSVDQARASAFPRTKWRGRACSGRAARKANIGSSSACG